MHTATASQAGAAVAVLALLLAPAIAQAEETRCTGTLRAGTHDEIVVPDGANCVLRGVRAKGSVKVGTGARLDASAVRIVGNLQAEGARQVILSGRSTVGGSMQLKQGGGARIVGNRIEGDLQLDDNRVALAASGNTIGGNLQAVKNRGGLTLSGNVIDGALQCKENAPAPRGGGNRAESKQDQCSRL